MTSTWYVERVLPVVFTGGFFIHLIRAARSLLDGNDSFEDFLLWPVDGALAILMTFCAVALIVRRRQMFEAYDFSPRWRRVVYVAVTVYVTVSIPGHVLFLTTGNTVYFSFFPVPFSVAIDLVYIALAVFWITLPARRGAPEPSTAPLVVESR